jgi:predicted TIM-barrel fold metal-dependent hydrolase
VKRPLVLAAVLALPACSHQTCLPPLPHAAQIKGELDTLAGQHDPIEAKTRVVDVHIHTFNARYLPLRGILLGKRDAGAPITWLISDKCAKVIAADLASRTELAPFRLNDGDHRTMQASGPSTGQVSFACGIFSKLIDKGIKKGVWDGAKTIDQQLAALDDMAGELTMSERFAVRATADMMGMDEHLETPGVMMQQEGAELDPIKTFLRYLWTITQSDARMIDLYRHFHHGTSHSGNIRVVSHMMDLAPVYDQDADGKDLIDFVKEQIPRTRAYTQQQTSEATYFVAYNPYRNHWKGGKEGDALKIVMNAVERQGAAGVNVYPPSGYRAAGNNPKKRALALLTKYPGRQWDTRYAAWDDHAAESLNRELEKLLVWCTNKKIPVFTHCGHGEFEARKGYGAYHADPQYWKQYLETNPEKDGSPCRLKLCLGHAGGSDYWYGCGEHSDWGKTVYELCTTYPNVYCEITTGTEILNPDRRAYFVEHVSDLIAKSKADDRHDFGKKILYGTDWPQPDAGNPKYTLRKSQLAFRHRSLRAYYADYFHLNAERYLRCDG